MLLPRRLLPLFATLSTLPLTDSGRALGTLLLGAPGAGKTICLSLLLLVDLLRGLPGCVLDPLGTLSEALLFRLGCFLSEFPPGDDEVLWQRLRYVPLGDESVVTHFPIYYQRKGESLFDAANRLITVLERANPQLVTGSPLTWPAARRLAVNAGMLLTALSLQLDKVEDLLFQTIAWEKSGTFDEAIRRNPQAEPAVSYFRNYYLPLLRSEQRRIAGTFLDQVSFLQNPQLREIFSGSNTPGIEWEEEEALGRIVVINCKGITDQTSRSFATQWLFEHLYPHLKARGRRNTPFVVIIDEFAHLATAGTAENKPLAELFDELLAQYARNNRLFVTIALQSVDQVDERLQRTLFRMGTLISGRAGSAREARTVADRLFRKDIHRVQHYRKVWGKDDPPPLTPGFSRYREENLRAMRQLHPKYPYYVLDYEPEHMSLENQTEDAAGTIQKLGALEFLCRPALSEGVVSQEVISLAIADALRDPDTGEYSFPDPEQDAALIAQLQHESAARSGMPITEILKEQEELTQGTLKTPQQTPLEPAVQSGEEVRQKDAAQPEPGNVMETPSRPIPDETERQLLSFVTEHPDMPVTEVYKALGIGVTHGKRVRASLKAQGLIDELEIRTGRTSGGRPMKCLIPTMTALELLGNKAPPGRGGMVHRYVQRVVAKGATAKGYTAQIEHTLSTGTIVDVHLENGQQRIAVEIAVASTPERELAHIKHCLTEGYDHVYTIFAEEHLLGRTALAMQTAFSIEELGKIRLVPLRQLAQVV